MRCRVLVTVLTIFAVWGINASVIASEPPFSYGLVQNSCAPWDGAAIDIRLTTEPVQCQRVNGSYLNIGVWRGLPIRSAQIVKFGATSDAGFASLCRKVGDCERAESGTIVFERFQDGSGASGRYELHFKGGKDMNAVFDAKWCESHSICRKATAITSRNQSFTPLVCKGFAGRLATGFFSVPDFRRSLGSLTKGFGPVLGSE